MIKLKENKKKYHITISKDLSIADYIFFTKKIKSIMSILRDLAIKNDIKKYIRREGDCDER